MHTAAKIGTETGHRRFSITSFIHQIYVRSVFVMKPDVIRLHHNTAFANIFSYINLTYSNFK